MPGCDYTFSFAAEEERLDHRKFELAVRRLADSLSYGSDSSPFFGSGIDFAQSRPYQSGDSVKQIDWRVTARTGRFHVKEYEAPKRMPVWLLLDTSASMCVTSVSRSKYMLGVHIAGAIGLLAQKRLSPAGFFGLGEREFFFRPTLSQVQWMESMQRLNRFNVTEKTQLEMRIRQWVPAAGNRSVVFVLSDFHDPSAIDALRLVAARHDCVAIHLVDPAEHQAPSAGFLRVREAETGRTFTQIPHASELDFDTFRSACLQSQVDYVRIETDRKFIPALRHFLSSRNRLGKGAR